MNFKNLGCLLVLSLVVGAAHWWLAGGGIATCNLGVSLGIGRVAVWQLGGVWLVLMGWRMRSGLSREWMVVLAASLVNIIDRMEFGCVRDYVRVPLLGVYNNVNDWLIFGGMLVILGRLIWPKK